MKGYDTFKDNIILRDYLAYDRTRLALVRTFLSIARTALGLLASGAGLVIVNTSEWLVALGYVLVAVAAVVFIGGGLYCLRFKKRLDKLKDGESNSETSTGRDSNPSRFERQ